MQENQVKKQTSFFPSGIPGLVPIVIAVAGVVLLYFWLTADAAQNLTVRLPSEQDFIESDEDSGIIEGQLVTLAGTPADLPGAWPRFRGENFDAIALAQVPALAPTGYEEVKLANFWPDEGPQVLWSKELGEGFAGAAILEGRVYVIDYDQENEADLIRCMSLDDGSDIWNYSYPIKIKRYHGMSRTVPAVTGKYIVTMGPKCHVTCLDSMTGDFKWMLDLVKDYGTEVPEWYAGQCPLIEDGKAIIAPGGTALMMAVDCETGEIIWQTPNSNKWKMTHSSIMPAEFMGIKMYVYCTNKGVVGISAQDGEILWEYPDWFITLANVASPLVVGDGKIFLSGGYNSGALMLQLTKEDEKFIAEEVFRLNAKVFGSEQHTPIFYNDHIYGIRPDKQLACLNLDGNVVWTSSRTVRFGSRGLGPYSIADGKIFVLDDEGTLTLAEANTTGYTQLAQAKVLEGPDAWAPMAFAAGRLIIRDMNRMICLDISEK